MKKTMQILILAVAVLTMVACGAQTGATPAPLNNQPTQETTMPTEEPSLPTRQPSGEAGGAGVSDAIVQQALAQVATKTGLAADTLTVVSTEQVEFPDTALGCPEPGVMYATQIVPGWQITVQAGEDTFLVGTTLAGDQVAVCQQAQ